MIQNDPFIKVESAMPCDPTRRPAAEPRPLRSESSPCDVNCPPVADYCLRTTDHKANRSGENIGVFRFVQVNQGNRREAASRLYVKQFESDDLPSIVRQVVASYRFHLFGGLNSSAFNPQIFRLIQPQFLFRN